MSDSKDSLANKKINKKHLVIGIVIMWLIIFVIIGIAIFRMSRDYRPETHNKVALSDREPLQQEAIEGNVQVKFTTSHYEPDQLEATIKVFDPYLNEILFDTFKTTNITSTEDGYLAFFDLELEPDIKYFFEFSNLVAYRSNLSQRINT